MATAAAAVMAKARRDLVSHFLSRNAVSAANAVAYEPRRRIDRRWFARFKDKGVLIEAKPGRWFIDVRALDEDTQSRRRRAGVLIAGSLVLASAIAAIFA